LRSTSLSCSAVNSAGPAIADPSLTAICLVVGSRVGVFATSESSDRLGVVAELELGGLGAGAGDGIGAEFSAVVEGSMVIPAVAEFDADGTEEALLDSDPVCGAAGEVTPSS